MLYSRSSLIICFIYSRGSFLVILVVSYFYFYSREDKPKNSASHDLQGHSAHTEAPGCALSRQQERGAIGTPQTGLELPSWVMYMYHCHSVSCILAHLQLHRDAHPEKWHK